MLLDAEKILRMKWLLRRIDVNLMEQNCYWHFQNKVYVSNNLLKGLVLLRGNSYD